MNDNIKAIREALVMRNHLYCEDPWYSCPKVEDGCANPSVGADCDCGADEHNAKVTLALAALDCIEAQKKSVPEAMIREIAIDNCLTMDDFYEIAARYGFEVSDE